MKKALFVKNLTLNTLMIAAIVWFASASRGPMPRTKKQEATIAAECAKLNEEERILIEMAAARGEHLSAFQARRIIQEQERVARAADQAEAEQE
jgi:hypothetical protein